MVYLNNNLPDGYSNKYNMIKDLLYIISLALIGSCISTLKSNKEKVKLKTTSLFKYDQQESKSAGSSIGEPSINTKNDNIEQTKNVKNIRTQSNKEKAKLKTISLFKYDQQGSKSAGSSIGEPSINTKNNNIEQTKNVKNIRAQTNNNASLNKIIEKIKSGEIANIIVMTGAGISTNAGIPDFRSKNNFYDKIRLYQKKNKVYLGVTDNKENFYTLKIMNKEPKHFFKALSECGKFDESNPTITHYFFTLLDKHTRLLRYYTQNVDELENKAKLSDDKIVRYHGGFHISTCTNKSCGNRCKYSLLSECYKKGNVPYCNDLFKNGCKGILKPDVVFFKEPISVPKTQDDDFNKCDLLIVVGTSLSVAPFKQLVKKVKSDVPRILINMEKVGDFVKHPRKDDLFLKGDCDSWINKIVELLGWHDELETLSN